MTTAFHILPSLLIFFSCFFILFHSSCLYARVLGRTLQCSLSRELSPSRAWCAWLNVSRELSSSRAWCAWLKVSPEFSVPRAGCAWLSVSRAWCALLNVSRELSVSRAGCAWLNVSRELSVAEHVTGRVAVLDFFTYCCVNCLHVLHDLHALEAAHPPEAGLLLVVSSWTLWGQHSKSAGVRITLLIDKHILGQ